MITLLIVLGAIFAYLILGGMVAKASLPHIWARARRDSYSLYPRSDVVKGAVCRALLWPVMGLYELLAIQIDATDPKEQERRILEQETRIAELERELDIR